MKKWRIDNVYEKVYEYDEEAGAYIHYAGFFAIGINSNMSKDEQIRIIEEDYYR